MPPNLRNGSARERKDELRAEAPLRPRTRWMRADGRIYLAGTLGTAFDAWQRHLAALSAADAYFAQQIGLEEIEAAMDAAEAEARAALAPGETLRPRRSPGYGDLPLELSREILTKTDAARKLGIAITDALLLVPSKSVTAVCEIERNER